MSIIDLYTAACIVLPSKDNFKYIFLLVASFEENRFLPVFNPKWKISYQYANSNYLDILFI